MDRMFQIASKFNQPIGNWNVKNVELMPLMFLEARFFNQDLSKWCVTKISSEPPRFSESTSLTNQNKPKWGTCPP
jgi:hypothetical protein